MSIYSGVSVTTLRLWLSDAQVAYHKLLTGTLVVSLGQGDRRLGFSQTEIPALAGHIKSLQTAISIAEGNTNVARPAIATWNRT